jgi:hypothetical protein
VDEFNDLTVADTTSDFASAIEGGRLTSYRDIKSFSLAENADPDLLIRDKFVTLPYTEVSAIAQPLATTDGTESVQTTMIAKFDGFVSLTPESDYFYSVAHQPSVTDTFGRYFEIRQNIRGSDPALTNAFINSIGAGNYSSTYYSGYNIVGQNQPTSSQSTIYAPAYSVAPESTNNPVSVTPINLNFAGVRPFGSLNDSWTGVVSDLPKKDIDFTTAFQPGWQESAYLSGSPVDTDPYGIGRFIINSTGS